LSVTTPQHIRARPEDVSKYIVVVGDPARAKFIAENFLEKPKLVNESRGFLIYTGDYKDVKVSVAVHGIGGPSAAIVFEELRFLGAEVMIRLGTCGGLIKDIDIGDFVVPTGAAHNPGGTLWQYFGDIVPPASPDPRLTVYLIEEAKKRWRTFVGPVYSSDAFYTEDPELAKKLSKMGIIAIEMEVATLFSLSWARGYKAAALLVASDNLVVPGKERLRGHEELEDKMRLAAEAVLEALRKVARS
jgi:5'-methylthioadenosine phosphorylase